MASWGLFVFWILPGARFAAGDGCSGHIPARAPIAGLGTLEEVPQGDGENCGWSFCIQTPPKRGTLQEIKHIPLMVGIFEDDFPFPQVGYINFLNEVLVQCVFDCFCFLPGIILITRSPVWTGFWAGWIFGFFSDPWEEAQDSRVLKKYHLKWSPFRNIPYACTYIYIYIHKYIYIYIIYIYS